MKFLIVDDDDDSLFLARRNLTMTFPGADITTAKMGQEALNLFQNGATFDAVVTDYRMPWMDGLTLTRKLRELNVQVPIILRVALKNMEPQAREEGVTVVLPWYRWRELGDVVKQALQPAPAKG